jgi:uncharacterized protein (TIGR02001 family)
MRPGSCLQISRLGACLFGAVLAGGAQSARADGSVGGHVDATTDYVFRGMSQTRGSAAAQADLHYQTPNGWFVGVWGSTIDPNRGPGATLEVNAYAGRGWSFGGPWNAKVTGVQYFYPNDTDSRGYDYFELATSISYEDRLGLTVSWSPNTSRRSSYGTFRSGQTISYEIVGQLPLFSTVSATGSLGYYDLSQLLHTGYTYGSAGLGGSYENLRVDVAWFATSNEAQELFGTESTGERWALTVTWSF